jgi:cytochrome b6-f complex iron-sulfur subunit
MPRSRKVSGVTDTQSNPRSVQRRDFLSLAAKALLGLSGFIGMAGLFRYFSFRPVALKQTRFELGQASEYPPGSRIVVPEAKAIVIHNSSEFTALALTCPHLGCVVEVAREGFGCPCHGSLFDLTGSVLRGPARDPLLPLRVEQAQDGQLVLFTG